LSCFLFEWFVVYNSSRSHSAGIHLILNVRLTFCSWIFNARLRYRFFFAFCRLCTDITFCGSFTLILILFLYSFLFRHFAIILCCNKLRYFLSF
jgi:hypothetical protein